MHQSPGRTAGAGVAAVHDGAVDDGSNHRQSDGAEGAGGLDRRIEREDSRAALLRSDSVISGTSGGSGSRSALDGDVVRLEDAAVCERGAL
jgi:hypothetical protein